MSDHTSILCSFDREIVQGVIRGEVDISGNDQVLQRIIERMWSELEAWHRMAWLWADMRVSGKRGDS